MQNEDEYELMRDNYLAQIWIKNFSNSKHGKVNNFMKIIMSIVKSNQFYKMLS